MRATKWLRVMVLALAVGTSSCSDSSPPRASGPSLEMTDFAFELVGVDLVAGRQATIRVTNKGSVNHDLSIPAIEASLDYAPGHTSNLIFIAPSEPGPIEVFCKYHRDRGMTATFVVRG